MQVVWEQSLTGIQVIYTFLSECSLGENYKGMSEVGWGRASQACGFRLSLSIGLGVSLLSMSHSSALFLQSVYPSPSPSLA